jgi:sugar phosphate isomerase/epimerase
LIDRIYSAAKQINLEAGIDFALQNQVSYEIPSFLSPQVLDNKTDEMERYRTLLKDFKGTLSLHGPIYDMNPVSLDPRIAESSRYRYSQAVDVCKELGVKYLVFHSQYTPIFTVANVYKEWLAQSVDYWQELIESQVQGSNVVILMENFMDETPDILNTLISRVDSPHMKACLDTGHVNLFSDIPPIDWLDEFGDQLAYIHAHNNHGEKDDHLAIHKGTVDMEGFLNHLVLLPHKVSVAIEVFNLEGVQESYEALQPYMQLQTEHASSKSFLI